MRLIVVAAVCALIGWKLTHQAKYRELSKLEAWRQLLGKKASH